MVDDDAGIRDLLCTYLRDCGMATDGVPDGEAMWRRLDARRPDLVILDVMLPGTDGLSLCRALAEQRDIPVIMLTAKGGLIDRIVGLEMGADDYLPKPFDPRELLARIKVVLRRSDRRAAETRPVTVRRYEFAGWSLDVHRHLLLATDGVGHNGGGRMVSGSEFLALCALLEKPHAILSRSYLSQRVYGREHDPSDRSIDMSISRLRHLLGDDARKPMLIHTVRNGGYVLSTDVVSVA